MKFTLDWLQEHLDTDRPLAELADKLTMIGLEVERIEDKAKLFAPFVIARVVEARQHPNADRLRVCMVDIGKGDPIQVVCGAPNARTGMKGVFAPPGAFIPGKNVTLGVGKIRDVESRGMLVSEFELQISDDHEGIIDLPENAPVGANYAHWAGLDDPVIEINLTPNRADCAGVHGVARDLGAADMGKFKDPTTKPVKGEFPCPAAEAAKGDRAAADQCARRHHEFHHLRPRPAVACVRCRQGARQSHGAAGSRRRDAACARR
jgi:phenylalanyl-tRNA synthetase beta chain